MKDGPRIPGRSSHEDMQDALGDEVLSGGLVTSAAGGHHELYDRRAISWGNYVIADTSSADRAVRYAYSNSADGCSKVRTLGPACQRFVPHGLPGFEVDDGQEHRPQTSVIHDVVELLLEIRHLLLPAARRQVRTAVLHGTGRRLRRMRQARAHR